jgi:hypothetical protein
MPTSIETKRQWYSNHHREFSRYIWAKHPTVDSTDVLLRMLSQLHTCESNDEGDFLLWADSFIKEESSNRVWYDSFKNLSMADVLALAATKRRKNCKPMMTETRGDRTFIKLDHKKGFHIWIIPSEWLPVAAALWPVSAKFSRSIGWWICKSSKKQKRDGTWTSIDIPVHHLYADAQNGERVIAHDGNYLNYLPDNLALANDGQERNVDNPDAPPTRAIPLRSSDAHPEDWKPAKAKSVPGVRNTLDTPSMGVNAVDSAARKVREAWGIGR